MSLDPQSIGRAMIAAGWQREPVPGHGDTWAWTAPDGVWFRGGMGAGDSVPPPAAIHHHWECDGRSPTLLAA